MLVDQVNEFFFVLSHQMDSLVDNMSKVIKENYKWSTVRLARTVEPNRNRTSDALQIQVQRLQFNLGVCLRHCPWHLFRIEFFAFRCVAGAQCFHELISRPFSRVTGGTDVRHDGKTGGHRFAAFHIWAMTSLACDRKIFSILDRYFAPDVHRQWSRVVDHFRWQEWQFAEIR